MPTIMGDGQRPRSIETRVLQRALHVGFERDLLTEIETAQKSGSQAVLAYIRPAEGAGPVECHPTILTLGDRLHTLFYMSCLIAHKPSRNLVRLHNHLILRLLWRKTIRSGFSHD